MSLHEIEEAATIVQQTADPEANIIVGQVINPDMGDDLVVTVIATGFEREEQLLRFPWLRRGASRNGQQVVTGTGLRRWATIICGTAAQGSRSSNLLATDGRCKRVDGASARS